MTSCSHQRPQAQLYACGVRQTIPGILIPLRQEELQPTLELQPLLHQVCDRARFELAIDYQQPPVPKLSADDQAWLQKLIHQVP